MAKKDIFKALKKDVLTSTPKTPTQKVSPIKKSKLEGEEPFTLWIPKTLMKKLKLKALENETSLKKLIVDAIEVSLKN